MYFDFVLSHWNPKSIYDLWHYVERGENPTKVLRYGVLIGMEKMAVFLLEIIEPFSQYVAAIIFFIVVVQETTNFYLILK